MPRGERGFTLVETLVVIAIVLTLAAILLPVYEVAQKRAENVPCSSNLHNLALAVGMYAEDCDGFLIPARTSAGAPAVFGTSWDINLLPYHRNEGLYLCVSDQTPTWASGTTCLAHSYGVNLDLTLVNGYNGSALPLEEVKSPTETILLFDVLGSYRTLGLSYDAHGLTRVDARHNGGANFAFVDGHVKWHQPRTTATGSVNMWRP